MEQQPAQELSERVSQLKLYSIGVVATPKLLSQQTIEVVPTEDMQFLDGEISDAGNSVTMKGTENGGGAYEAAANTANTVQATWLHLGQGNRRTAPDVRSGAHVALWQFGDDTETLFWTTLVDDLYLRRLETVIWSFSATGDPGATLDHTNCYYLEVSTHTGQITLHTTKANGEPFEYTFQLNTKEGKFSVEDDIGNLLFLDSQEHQFKMINTEGSFLEIVKETINMKSIKDTNLDVGQNFNVKVGKNTTFNSGSNTSLTSGQNHLTHATVITEDAPAFIIAGNISTRAGRGGSSGSGVLDGSFRVKGSVDAEQNLTAQGRIKGNIVESVQNFVGPNV